MTAQVHDELLGLARTVVRTVKHYGNAQRFNAHDEWCAEQIARFARAERDKALTEAKQVVEQLSSHGYISVDMALRTARGAIEQLRKEPR